jgi:hypothetical protein
VASSGYAANVGGLVTALIAAVPGFLDFNGIPKQVRAKQVRLVHKPVGGT